MHTSHLPRLTGVVLGLSTLLALVLLAFAWPVSELEPRSLPVVVAGPDQAAQQVAAQLAAEAGENAFEVATVVDREDAVTALEEREAYVAVVPDPSGPPEFLVAGAASPAVAQLVTQIATETGGTVTDVVPAPEADPRGTTFGAGALPLVLGGLITGVASSLAFRGRRQRLAAVALVAVVGGSAVAGILQGWLDVLTGSFTANAGVIALGTAAMALTVVGLWQVLGEPGIGLAALLIMLLGNPLSGITSAPELLPLGWLGQLLPPGALGSALRSTAYFDGAGALVPLLVLAAWAAIGAGLALLPDRARDRDREPEPVAAAAG